MREFVPIADEPRVRAATFHVLTQYLAELLDSDQPAEATPRLLRLLNSASETPYLIWNAALRAELDAAEASAEASYPQPQPQP